jgi:hypothetical protein
MYPAHLWRALDTFEQIMLRPHNCADLGEIFKTVKVIAEGDIQSWYTAWEATADRALALAERTHDSLSKGGAFMRACTYQRTAESLLAQRLKMKCLIGEKTSSRANRLRGGGCCRRSRARHVAFPEVSFIIFIPIIPKSQPALI